MPFRRECHAEGVLGGSGRELRLIWERSQSRSSDEGAICCGGRKPVAAVEEPNEGEEEGQVNDGEREGRSMKTRSATEAEATRRRTETFTPLACVEAMCVLWPC
ncbi:hypothetical protein HPP92_016254 [Vanilla planifolia]|uniref:Uncharacterized protein n=1 Tax=Vanilla planifolia TaxID=51239 RepID=A0A835QNB2_VANPL|nr:hypothetical protein HPP92_016254 [Vanilla planifolia]